MPEKAVHGTCNESATLYVSMGWCKVGNVYNVCVDAFQVDNVGLWNDAVAFPFHENCQNTTCRNQVSYASIEL